MRSDTSDYNKYNKPYSGLFRRAGDSVTRMSGETPKHATSGKYVTTGFCLGDDADDLSSRSRGGWNQSRQSMGSCILVTQIRGLLASSGDELGIDCRLSIVSNKWLLPCSNAKSYSTLFLGSAFPPDANQDSVSGFSGQSRRFGCWYQASGDLGRYKPLGGGTSSGNTARVFFFVSFNSKIRNTRIVDSYMCCVPDARLADIAIRWSNACTPESNQQEQTNISLPALRQSRVIMQMRRSGWIG